MSRRHGNCPVCHVNAVSLRVDFTKGACGIGRLGCGACGRKGPDVIPADGRFGVGLIPSALEIWNREHSASCAAKSGQCDIQDLLTVLKTFRYFVRHSSLIAMQLPDRRREEAVLDAIICLEGQARQLVDLLTSRPDH